MWDTGKSQGGVRGECTAGRGKGERGGRYGSSHRQPACMRQRGGDVRRSSGREKTQTTARNEGRGNGSSGRTLPRGACKALGRGNHENARHAAGASLAGAQANVGGNYTYVLLVENVRILMVIAHCQGLNRRVGTPVYTSNSRKYPRHHDEESPAGCDVCSGGHRARNLGAPAAMHRDYTHQHPTCCRCAYALAAALAVSPHTPQAGPSGEPQRLEPVCGQTGKKIACRPLSL